MCFTVAIVRNNTLVTTENYYNNLPADWEKKNDLPEFLDYFFVSGFEHPKLPIIKKNGIELYEWGLIPSWTRNAESAIKFRTNTLNAKSETIKEKPSFRQCIDSKRCILPVTGFYDWQEVKGEKIPYYIYDKEHKGLMLGSIYDNWIDSDTGELRNTFSIVTTVANPLMAKIHNVKKRMPLILSDENIYKWLDTGYNYSKIESIIQPFSEDKMDAHTISKEANNVRNYRNVPTIMDKVEYRSNTDLQLSLF